MAKTIQIAGATYYDVPAIEVPTEYGEAYPSRHRYCDNSGVDATAADVAVGKTIVDKDGNEVAGNAILSDNNVIELFSDDGTDINEPVNIDLNEHEDLGGDWYGPGLFFRSSESTGSEATPGTSSWSLARPHYFSLKLPNNLQRISDYAMFCAIGLVSVDCDTEYDMVYIGDRAFFCCANLKTIGKLWDKIAYLSASSLSTRNGGNSDDNVFEYGKNIVAPQMLVINGTYAINRAAFASFTAPKLSYAGNYTFANNPYLGYADFTDITSITSGMFSACKNMSALYLRGESVVTLESTNAFANTPALTNPERFTLWVPRALVDAYKTATNWSVLYDDGDGISISAVEDLG